MNAVKIVIQKEEYIALALNKYILQTGKIPKDDQTSELNWSLLTTDEYLGSSFDKNNPITNETLKVVFDENNNCFIKGVITNPDDYTNKNRYFYNFYVNRVFRINTQAPKNGRQVEIIKGSKVIYDQTQKQIAQLLKDGENIVLDSKNCPSGESYYELKGSNLDYKYCSSTDDSVDIYQEAPVYVENIDNLPFIKANIGDKGYALKNGKWYEYYYQGDVDIPWVPVESGSILNNEDEEDIEDKIISYIPNSKDLVIRRDGGCMLANGDIFCWGNNKYKKAGISSYGQIDKTLSPDYVNTPVMLKVQINDIDKIDGKSRRDKKWFNNPYRIKFEKMSMNSTNVCGVSPIFKYTQSNSSKKFGGDLYCNGQINSSYYENLEIDESESAVLKRNKFFAWGKNDFIDNDPKEIKISEDGGEAIFEGPEDNKTEKLITRDEIYLKDIVMVEDTIAVLSDKGKIYTVGKNYNGALGIGQNDKFFKLLEAEKVDNENTVFEKIFALRDTRTFGAIDTNNYFWIWGERNGTVYNKPTKIDSTKKFNPDAIFTNTNEFILKGLDNNFYKTRGDLDFISIPSFIDEEPISISYYKDNKDNEYWLYINKQLELKGSSNLLECRESNEISLCNNKSSKVFEKSINDLNKRENEINNKKYSNFSNISIFKLDHNILEIVDDFEGDNSSGWELIKYSDKNFQNEISKDPRIPAPITQATETQADTSVSSVTSRVDPTKILGRFLIAQEAVEKTYEFGKSYANYEVEVELDFFEIDSWDMERFQVFLNDKLVSEDGFIHDKHEYFQDTNDSGIYTLNLGSHYNGGIITENGINYSKNNDEKYVYKLRGKLDNQGKLKVHFRVRELNSGEYGVNDWDYGQTLVDESWGVDNIKINLKETDKKFVCAMTGLESKSQMYCWGNVARSIPIVNTSLYDVSKIDTVNKVFVTQDSQKKEQMSFDEYFNDGKLFLKYPTYIGGFDYEFYFK